MYSIRTRDKAIVKLAAAVMGLLAWLPTVVQAQTSTGQTGTTCTQSGLELTCTTVAKYTLPSGVVLQTGGVGAGNFVLNATSGGPACGALAASPTTVTSGLSTSITLTLNGCVANTLYTWQTPAVQSPNSQTPHIATHDTLTLTGANATQTYSVQACAPSGVNPCATYTVTVSVTQATQALTGCKVNPATATITTASSQVLAVSCDTGTSNPLTNGVTWQWRKDGVNVLGANSSTYTVPAGTPQGVYNYTVSMTNNASTNPVISVGSTVMVNPAITSSCPPGVAVPSRTITAGDNYSTWYSTGHPGSTPYVVAIDVPVGAANMADTQSAIQFSPQSGPGAREYTISRSPCDFAAPVNSGGYDMVNLSYDPNVQPTPHGYILAPGRWYLNLRSPIGGPCADTRTCSMNMQAQP